MNKANNSHVDRALAKGVCDSIFAMTGEVPKPSSSWAQTLARLYTFVLGLGLIVWGVYLMVR